MLIGSLAGAIGLAGQMKMKAISTRLDHIRRTTRTVYIGPKYTPYQLRQLKEVRPQEVVIILAEVNTRDAANALRGYEIAVREHEIAPLDEGEYFYHQLVDLTVFTADGETLGRVREVIETGANDVLVVAREAGADVLVPMISDVVRELDIAGGRIVVQLLDGLLG